MLPYTDFKNTIYEYYAEHKRVFPWRDTNNPYLVMVSEYMLQQTQTHRVVPKFNAFIHEFPTIESLAQASFEMVLRNWQGLGYNRRAKYLHQAALGIYLNYKGTVPANEDELMLLPGIGKYTAAAICAFAFNKPTIFIETNIRTVFIHFYFNDKDTIHDRDIYELVVQTLDRESPRQWYYALMDYGSYLKGSVGNLNNKSAHYVKQSKFQGSFRQIRSAVIKQLLVFNTQVPTLQLIESLPYEPVLIEKAIQQLIDEQFINNLNDTISIKE
ncbi:A/G-specific adenine glycosylase [candidate division WWE3 bacterium]|nr:A/G-specific adenine glycosylase [candidate division WWE3 bacterium]